MELWVKLELFNVSFLRKVSLQYLILDFKFFSSLNSGFPLWLHFIPGIKFRTDNEPFKAEMKRFTAKIVDLMKQENLYASQGGPIILSQVLLS